MHGYSGHYFLSYESESKKAVKITGYVNLDFNYFLKKVVKKTVK
jgi:hypothetical protein